MPKTLEYIQEVNQIPTEDQGLKVNTIWSAVYRTHLVSSYISIEIIKKRIAREIEIYEILRKNPYP